MPENEMSPETGGWPGFIIRGFQDRAAHKREGEAAEFENAYNSTDDRGERDAIIKDAYAKDPSKVKAFVENLARRMVGKKPAPEAPSPYTGPEGAPAPKTRSEAMTEWAHHGKSPDKRAAEAAQDERDASGKSKLTLDKQQTEQEQGNIFGLIDKYITDPEQNKTAKEEYVRRQAGAKNSFKNLPGAAGQPYQTPSGSWVKPIQGEDGTITEQPMPAEWKPPAPKLSTAPKIGTSGGKNIYATETPEGWKSTLDGKILHDFRPLPTYAQTGNFTPVETVTPEGVGVGSFNRKTGITTESTGGTKTLPTGVAKDLNASIQAAVGARTRLRTMEQNAQDALAGNQQAMLSLVANHIGMTLGAQKGARINQAVWNEAVASTPWLQKVAAKWGPDGYLSGVTLAPEQIKQMLGLAKQQAKNMQDQVEDTAKSSGVSLPAPKAAQGGGGGAQKFTDGGKHFNIPADKVEAFKRAHPNAKPE